MPQDGDQDGGRALRGRRQLLVRQGIDFMKLGISAEKFSKKFFGQIFALEFRTKFHPEMAELFILEKC
jgi:hypothetical protein